MNQENHKRIAEIINLVAIKWDPAWVELVNKFADYFEEEDIKSLKFSGVAIIEDRFNRKQFLEWVGVE